MRRILPLHLVLVTLFFAACVTVNVYFPAAAAEQAADQIIDTVTGQSGTGQTPAPAPSSHGPSSGAQSGTTEQGAGQSSTDSSGTAKPQGFTSHTSFLRITLGRALELLVPAAHAQANANLDISSPEIRAVTGSMQQRFTQLEKYFASGAVGLTADGLVEVRDPNAVPLAERATVKRLVAEDNRDRATLYLEIAKANKHPEWEPDIRRTFARRWVERGAKKGWYYQNASGSWVQK